MLDYCASRRNLEEIEGNEHFKLVHGDLKEADLLAYEHPLSRLFIDLVYDRYIVKNEEIDTVIHMAAQTHVDNSFNNSMAFTRDNILGTQVIDRAIVVQLC